MIAFVILSIIWLFLIGIIIYGLVLLLTVLVERILHNKKVANFKRTRKYNWVAIPSCLGLAILYLSINPAHNFKTAYIERNSDKYIITILWKGNLMVHDSISLFKKGTYIDSSKLTVPRPNGVISYDELPNEPGYYRLTKGAITIRSRSMKVDLYYDNYDDKIIEPSGLNGNYELEWRK